MSAFEQSNKNKYLTEFAGHYKGISFLRFIILFTVIVLALGSLYLPTVYAGEIIPAEITIGSAVGEPGEVVEVSISINNPSGMAGGNLELTFDPAKLEPQAIQRGELLGGYLFMSNPAYTANSLRIVWAGTTGRTVDGTLARITFLLKDSGRADLKLAMVNLSNAKTEKILVTVVDGTVVVNATESPIEQIGETDPAPIPSLPSPPVPSPVTPSAPGTSPPLKPAPAAGETALADALYSDIKDLAAQTKPVSTRTESHATSLDAVYLEAVMETMGYTAKDARVEISLQELAAEDSLELLGRVPLGKEKGLIEIGAPVVSFAVILTGEDVTAEGEKINTFMEPPALTLDLSYLEIPEKDIPRLIGVKYVEGEPRGEGTGSVAIVKLGGTYDATSKTFTFHTDSSGLHGVLLADRLTRINLSIDSLETTVDDKTIQNDVAPTIINNRTMVPLRFIAENLGAVVGFHDETKTALVTLGAKEIRLTVGQPIPGFDTPATIVNNRTLVPLRYVSQELDAGVLWFQSTRSVAIVR